MKDKFQEILRFAVVGGVCFLIEFGLLFVLKEYAQLQLLIANGFAFIVSVILNYYLCKLFVFKNANKQSTKQITIFFGSSVAGLFLNSFLMWLFVEKVLIYYLFAKIIVAGIVMVWNYILKNYALNKL
jgi:putative flippase GtrA